MSNKLQLRSLYSRLATGVSLGTIAFLVAQSANAQDTDLPDNVLEQIVVTGLKRGEVALEDAPVSVTALGGQSLRDGGFLDIADAASFAPSVNEGVNAGNRTQKTINIRGISQNPAVTGGATGYYVGDAAFPESATTPSARLYDIERVEIFRGPQSTLYGNGAMGGVVRFIPNAPNLTEFEGSIFGGWSNTEGGADNYHGYGALSLPLVEDMLALRIAGGSEKIGGFGDTGIVGLPASGENQDGGRVTSLRVAIKFEPTENLSIDFLYQRDDSKFGALATYSPFDTTRLISGPDDRQDVKYDMYAGTVKYDFGFAELTNVTTYLEQESASVIDVLFPLVNSVVATSDGERTYWGNETRLASSGSSPFNWLVGLFVTDDTTDSVSSTLIETFIPDPISTTTSIVDLDGTSRTTRETLSLFGEVSYDFFDGKLVPLVGLRYFEDRYRARSDTFTEVYLTSLGGVPFVPPLLSFSGLTSDDSGTLKFDSVNPRFNLAYYPNDNATYFINISNGFRGGTYNGSPVCATTAGCERAVPSDEVWSYEVGTKQSLMGGQLFVDIAAYYMEWENVRELISVSGLNSQLAAGDAEIYGLDVALSATPDAIPGLVLTFAGNWNSAEYSSITPLGVIAGATEGERISYVPEWTATVGVDYQRSIANTDWKAHVNTSFSHIEAMRGGFGSNATLSVPATANGFGGERDLLRARIGVKNDHFGAYLVGTNLLNEEGPVTIGTGIATLEYPRTLGFELSANF